MPTQVSVRRARPEDLPATVEIYNQAVVDTVATFDLEPVTVEGRRKWFAQFGDHDPLWVAEIDRRIVGFAYYLPYRAKPAYAATKELTVYVDRAHHRRGVGRRLLETLVEHARSAGVHTLLAVLAGDNPGSAALHRAFDFEPVGHLRQVGRKFDEWVDTHYWQKLL